MIPNLFLKKLKRYLDAMQFKYQIEDEYLILNGIDFKIVDPKETLFDFELNFMPELDLSQALDIENWVYEFGGRWYYHEKGSETELKELKYIGKAKQDYPTKSFLGIHSGHELMNGIGLYKDWIKKAKFLGTKALAICENKTLSGALTFQSECKEAGIKSILGMMVPIKGEEVFHVKAYVKSFQGWLNLLKMNSILNLEGNQFVLKAFLEENNEGLYIVVDPKSTKFLDSPKCADFYQLETVNFLDVDHDKWYLNNLESFMKSKLEPVSITDAYYLEQRDYLTREILWSINKAFDYKTDNQFFKTKMQYANELASMFEKGNESWLKLFKEATKNESEIVKNCNFTYDTDTRHLPKYVMTEEESEQFSSNSELFLDIIKKGFAKKNIKDPQKYIDRLKKEVEVLQKGDVIDYFLVLYDILEFARSKDMQTGIGRGSAGGSLVAYLMDITKVDPIEFDLLFERFLNVGRMGEFIDRPAFKISTDNGKEIELIEGSLVRIEREEKETIVFVHELIEGDKILKY